MSNAIIKRGLLFASILLFLSVDILAYSYGDFVGKPSAQDKLQRSEFYALQVIAENDVKNAKDSLGAPDGRSAEILPGYLLLAMDHA